MPCYKPLQAYQCLNGAVVFTELKRHDTVRSLLLACGQCVGCRLERSRQWAVRCLHEAQTHKHNCFITLTYSDEKLPKNGTLRHSDYQGFMKRLRQTAERHYIKSITEPTKCTPLFTLGATKNRGNKFPRTRKNKLHYQHTHISYYMCGEYGEQTKRAHYHACIFGYQFPDAKFWRTAAKNTRLYTSEILNNLWGNGHTTIGEVTFESAAYVARYIMKKITGDLADKHYENIDNETGEITKKTPEYNKMSLKPGIGMHWLERYAADVYPEGRVVVRNHQSKSPKYYDKKYKKMNPIAYEDLLFEREKESQKRPEENTERRLATRERVAKARLAFFKRQLA